MTTFAGTDGECCVTIDPLTSPAAVIACCALLSGWLVRVGTVTFGTPVDTHTSTVAFCCTVVPPPGLERITSPSGTDVSATWWTSGCRSSLSRAVTALVSVEPASPSGTVRRSAPKPPVVRLTTQSATARTTTATQSTPAQIQAAGGLDDVGVCA